MPRCVLEEQAEWRRRIEAEPIEMLARRGPELLAAAKRAVGSWLGMREEDFGFVTNATEGVNAVLRSLDLRPGDELLTTTHVYHAVRQAMRYVAGPGRGRVPRGGRAAAGGVAGAVADAVLAALSPATRLVIIDHVTSPTALIFPVERIVAGCADRGIDVLVDGAHAPGMLPLDVPTIGAAYYAGNLHKWACGPKGSGFLWVRPDRQAARPPAGHQPPLRRGLRPRVRLAGHARLQRLARRAPRACSSWPTSAGSGCGGTTTPWPSGPGRMLCDRWGVEPLSPADGSMLGSMVTLPLPAALGRLTDEQARRLQQRLYTRHRVEAPVVLWGGRALVRPCCQVYNTPADLQRLAGAVLEIAGEWH